MEIVMLMILGIAVGLLAGLGHVGANVRMARGTNQ